jgi:hypothetical protein
MAKIYAGWNFSSLGTGTLEWTDSSGTFSVSFTTSTYAHVDLQSVMGTGLYDDFATALQTAMDASASARTFTVTYSTSSMAYTIAPNSGTIVLTTNTNTVMRNILGYNSLPTGAAASTSSQIRPYYVIDPNIDGQSSVTDDYEPSGFSFDGETDNGYSYGISRETAPTYYDWVQMMEPKEVVFTRAATSSVPWTYQHLFAHARNFEPIYYENTANLDTAVHLLRAEGAHWAPQRVTADYDGQWNIPFRTRVVGR